MDEKKAEDDLERMYEHQKKEIAARSEWGVIIRDGIHYGGIFILVLGLFFVGAFFVGPPTDEYTQDLNDGITYETIMWQFELGAVLIVAGILMFVSTWDR